MTNQNSEIVNLSQISHDLRNYIGGISGLANIIKDNIKSYQERQKNNSSKNFDKDLKEALEVTEMLIPHCDDALHYVDYLLTESTNSSQNLVSNCDLGQLIQELSIFHKNLADKNQVSIEVDIADDLPSLKCSIFRLKNILINLITNAIKYNKIGGKLTIKALYQLQDQKIIIEVTDTGIGMSEEEIKLATSGKGQEINKSQLAQFGKIIDSHGIGMVNILEEAKLINGEIQIESKKGEGTKVSLLIDYNLN
jgi:signal transduction histidine kinase